jgi:DNA-binding GntR family transcriptional regulator
VRIGFGRLDPVPAEHSRRGIAHQELLDAFRSRDVDAVQQAVLRHLDDNERIARRAIVGDA